jgi:hypothetical protein
MTWLPGGKKGAYLEERTLLRLLASHPLASGVDENIEDDHIFGRLQNERLDYDL